MKAYITISLLKELQHEVYTGRKKPFDLYDTSSPLFARVGKSKIAFKAYISRGVNKKIDSLTIDEITHTKLSSMRSSAVSHSSKYSNLNPLFCDDMKIIDYLNKIYSSVVSKGVVKMILTFPDSILNLELSSVSSHHAQVWKAEYERKGLSQETLRKKFYSLHAMLEYAVKNNHLSHHNLKTPGFKIDRTFSVAKILTDDDMHRLSSVLQTCTIRDRLIISFKLMTGARSSEILKLRTDDLDLNSKVAFVRSSGTKTKKGRYLQLPEPLVQLLVDYISSDYYERNSENWLFYNTRTQDRLKNFRKVWLTIRDAALLHNYRFYDLRHTYCSYLMKSSPLHVVQRLMGHSQLSTTAKYLHVLSDDTANAVSDLTDNMNLDRFT